MKKPKNPSIPKKKLDEFINGKMLKDSAYFTRVDCHFLWESGGVERFRINIWVEKDVKGAVYPQNYIEHSFFVHYDGMTGEINDKTVTKTGSYSRFCR